jgi:LAO/AO transport system kinase
MSVNYEKLVSELKRGNHRSLARVISLIEDRSPIAGECIKLLFPDTGKAHIIGVTGAPGAGKSTLVDQLVLEIRKTDKKVAILAIDPSSPFSGGALLGDRIRMANSSSDSSVFIRSMATRGALGGIAPATAEAIYALDASGFDYVIVETVGVGQAEIEIVRTCDTCVVVMVPGMGDGVQALKAGILEISDIFVINKADRPEVNILKRDLLTMLSLVENLPWTPKVLETVATEGQGIDKLLSEVQRHRAWGLDSGALLERKKIFLKESLYRKIASDLVNEVKDFIENGSLLEDALTKLLNREKDIYTLSRELINQTRAKKKGIIKNDNP